MSLSQKHCKPCEGGLQPFDAGTVHVYLQDLSGWIADEGSKRITKSFTFKNFVESMQFVDKVADIAEGEGHHPDIHISWNKVTLDLTTHAIKGLSENDFILATKIDIIKLNG